MIRTTGFLPLLAAATIATTTATPVAARAAGGAAQVETLPPALKRLYDSETDKLRPSAYQAFRMPPKPWTWCQSDSFEGNPWRVAVTTELRRLAELYKSHGLVREFLESDSNNDTSRQIAQIRDFVDRKCSIITAIPGSSTGLNGAIEAAYKAGIPFVTTGGSVTSPYAINVDSNYVLWGDDMMNAISDALHGKGDILLVEGIPGNPITAEERRGADRGLAAHPGLHMVRSVNGNWTANVTKSAVLQALATDPRPINAVWTTGSESRVVAEAFAEAGRPAPVITGSISSDALGFWKANPTRYRFEGGALLPGWTAQTLFRVGVRVLEGQGPKLDTLMVPIPVVRGDDLASWYRPCMTPASVSIFPVAPQDPLPPALMDAYFDKGEPVPFFDYASTPHPCAG